MLFGKNISDTDCQPSDWHENRRLPPAPQYSCHQIFLPVVPRDTRPRLSPTGGVRWVGGSAWFPIPLDGEG